MIQISTIKDVFEIEGRGCVFVPGISDSAPKDVVVRRGDAIELRKSDGSVVKTRIQDIEMVDYSVRTKSLIAFSLPREFSKRDVPVGTEVWLIRT